VARLPLATRESVPETQRTIFDEMVKGLGSIPRYGPGSVLIHVPKGTTRTITASADEPLVYVTIHRARAGLTVGTRRP